MARFVDRIEKRGETERRAEDAANQARLTAARSAIPAKAFEIPILNVEFKEHILVILQEAGIETLGDLILQSKLDPDKILAINGIGPKTFEEINTFIAGVQIPAEVQEPEVVGEAAVAELVEQAQVEPVLTTGEEPVVEQEATEEIPVEKTDAESGVGDTVKPVEDEVPFEDLFKVETMKFDFTAVGETTEEEEGTGTGADKKKKGKKKKGYTVEYDPDKDQATVKRTHKRTGEGWEEW